VGAKIESIEARIDNAKTNSRTYYSKIAERAQSYSRDFNGIMDRIRAQSVLQETQCISDYYKRATHIVQCGMNSKSFYQKESQKKKKDIEEKFQVARRNLKQLDQQREEKYEELKIKLVNCPPFRTRPMRQRG
jgi:archaellum biogenesis protein FlaJ (TadC family)